jgi:hypothetical protein
MSLCFDLAYAFVFFAAKKTKLECHDKLLRECSAGGI